MYGTHLHIFEKVLKPQGEHAVTARVKSGSCLGHLAASRQRKQGKHSFLQAVPQTSGAIIVINDPDCCSTDLGETSEASSTHRDNGSSGQNAVAELKTNI